MKPTDTEPCTDAKGFADAFLDCAPIGVIVLDSALRIIGFNKVAEDILGTILGAALQQHASALPRELFSAVEEAAATRQPVPRRCGVAGDNDVSLGATPCHDADGRLLSVLVEFQGISTIRAIAANLEHLDRVASIGAITAGVVHEMKNALVAVRTYFDLAKEGNSDPDLRALAASEIQRIERSVRQLLRGVRREEMRMAAFSIHALLQDALNLVRHELHTRGIELESHFTTANDRIDGDERQLRHALINLLMNAAEAINMNGVLTVTTGVVDAWERPHFRISVSDTGPGIAPENLARIFTPFFTTKPDGTGLGLAISRRIVEAHNGVITVESQLGEGTTFHLFLPLL